MHVSTGHSLPHRADLQGLRAIAILLVVGTHSGVPILSGGFVGVDVFFVLSGYLISGLLTEEYRRAGRINFAAFYARRLRRLLPALLAMLVAVVAIASLLLSSYEFKGQTRSGIFAATWTSNLFFSFSGKDYFDELQTRDLFLHTWSLGVEEQFYLLWPFVLLLLFKLVSTPTRGGATRGLLVALSVVFLADLALSLFWSSNRPLWSFYLMPSRIWQFSLGAMVYLCLKDTSKGLGPLVSDKSRFGQMPLLGLLGLALIIASALLLSPRVTYPGVYALAPSVGAALLIAAGVGRPARWTNRVLAHPILTWIGDRSYGWYLWHWPLLLLGVTLGIPAGSAGSLLLSALSLLIAAGSYRWIELPFWKGHISRASAPRTLVAGIVVMMAAVTLVLRYSNSVTNSDEAKAEAKLLAARTDLPPIYRYGCDTWYHSAEVSPCIIDTHHAKQTVVVLGDSIGLQWFSLWPTVFDPKSWRIVVLTKSSCPLVDEDFFYERIGKIYDVCNQWRDAVLTALPRLAPDVVIVGNAATYKFTPKQWADGTIRALAKIAAAAVDVLLIPGTPPLQVDGPGCLARQLKAERAGLHAAESCTNNDISPQTTDVSDFLKQAADRFANVQILNLNDLVCPDGHCGAQTADGLIVYRDQQHLTDSFVRSQTEAVRSRLRALGLGHYLTDGTVTRPERRPLASDHRRPSAR